MKYGFVRVAVAAPEIRVADTAFNCNAIINSVTEAANNGTSVIVLPELCVTGCTCGDLFLQDSLRNGAVASLQAITEATAPLAILSIIGVPLVASNGALYNCAAAVNQGKILGIVRKTRIQADSEFGENLYFRASELDDGVTVTLDGQVFSAPQSIRLCCKQMPELTIGITVGEDLTITETGNCAQCGAAVICNPSASSETVGKAEYRRLYVCSQSARANAAILYAGAGMGESTTDLVFSGHSLVAEAGKIMAEKRAFSEGNVYADIDVDRLRSLRKRSNLHLQYIESVDKSIFFSVAGGKEWTPTRVIGKTPFVPTDSAERARRCELILSIQAQGLKKRMAHINTQSAVLGLSGGLDSTLALLAAVKAVDLLSLPRRSVLAVTMPGFGTTDRTYQNAVNLANSLGVTLREVSIAKAVTLHLQQIGHDMSHDVTYENAQARERTQILMDIANQTSGFVIGTGDLSELALGWATYNGDHMSMYNVNGSVPKTLVRYLIDYYASAQQDSRLKTLLYDILDTPVSPELIPAVNGEIAQKTEEIVGPYLLHDFFLYYIVRFGFSPSKVFFLAKNAFAGDFDAGIILKWMRVFYARFFSGQFKRSCSPDSPKIGSVTLSPRGGWHMPSDASCRLWMTEIDGITV